MEKKVCEKKRSFFAESAAWRAARRALAGPPEVASNVREFAFECGPRRVNVALVPLDEWTRVAKVAFPEHLP